jgi:hypothetical protein
MTKPIPFEIIELETGTFHPLIKAEFKGLENYWWVIDTGASKSVFDKNITDYCKPDGANTNPATGIGKEVLETTLGIIEEFFIADENMGPIKMALVDFSHINKEYSKFTDKKVIGLIGSDFLVKYNATIDFKNKELTLDFYL